MVERFGISLNQECGDRDQEIEEYRRLTARTAEVQHDCDIQRPASIAAARPEKRSAMQFMVHAVSAAARRVEKARWSRHSSASPG